MTDATSEMTPPVDFRLLVHGFVGQAFVALGKMPHPMTGETKVELPWAQYFIDVLGMLQDKTRGNLTPDESSFLESQLETLRLNYVDTKKQAAAPEVTAEKPETTSDHDAPDEPREPGNDASA